MKLWALLFLVITLVLAWLGFSGIAGSATWSCQGGFVVFLILFVVAAVTDVQESPSDFDDRDAAMMEFLNAAMPDLKEGKVVVGNRRPDGTLDIEVFPKD